MKLTYNGSPVKVDGYIKMADISLVSVEATDGTKPFVGGDTYPIRTAYGIVRLDELIIDACSHENTVVHTTGGMHFDGEPWDDIEESLICTDCGTSIDE